jgi:hypothetical protein
MKTIRYFILCCFCLSIFASACKKELDDAFHNPEINPNKGSLFPGLFNGMLYTWKFYIQDYGEWWWELQGSGGLGIAGYAQVSQRYITDRYPWFADFDNLTGDVAFGADGQIWNNRFKDYYAGTGQGDDFSRGMRNWAIMKNELPNLAGQQLDDNAVFYSLATVLKGQGALITVDFYNSIPYSEAFRGAEAVFFAKYDDPKEIYVSVLNDMKKAYEELPALYAKMSVPGKAIFAQQDIAFKGDIQKWLQYINATRLKYAVRMSGVEETIAKQHIQDVLSKNNLPAMDFTFPFATDHDPQSGGTWIRGLNEGWPATFIPNIIMKRLNKGLPAYEPGIDDPRLPVLALPTKYSNLAVTPQVGDYRGVSYDADGQKPAYVAGERYYTGTPSTGDINQVFIQNSKSLYNWATFALNRKFPIYMTSLAETDLLLAEIALKNLGTTGKTPGDHIKDAIIHSTDFWYTVNALSTYEVSRPLLHPPKPSLAIVDTYATTIRTQFNAQGNLEDQMEVLMQQKYLHLNLMGPYELWAELRRTRHPKLEPMTFNAKVMKPMPERLKYPSSEQQTNTENYLKVRAQDNFITPIFWVPASKQNVKPYWDNYNYQ